MPKYAVGSRRALEQAQKEKAKRGTGTRAQTAKAGAPCGAKKRGGGKCTLAAGWGTPHPGIGKCRFHGGSVPNHIKAAAKEEYRQLFGTAIEINPLDALIWCIKVSAGEVQWLSDRMAELDEDDWVENTIAGKQFHLYARERRFRMQDLAKFSQTAISLGLTERAVKLAETYGQLIADYTQGLIADLMPYLSPEGKAKAPQIIRRRLLQLDAGRSDPLDTVDGEILGELEAA